MCIIVVKPQGVKLPSKEILHTCWKHNPDGAGFMYPFNKKGKEQIQIKKGYMTWNKFYKAITAVKNCESIPIVMHFRYATHGHIVPANTHPFPISPRFLRSVNSVTDIGVAHNGVLPYKDDNADSDTMQLIKDVLYPAYKKDKQFLEDKVFKKELFAMSTSKYAFLAASDSSVYLFGEYTKVDDIYYSNETYATPRVSVLLTQVEALMIKLYDQCVAKGRLQAAQERRQWRQAGKYNSVYSTYGDADYGYDYDYDYDYKAKKYVPHTPNSLLTDKFNTAGQVYYVNTYPVILDEAFEDDIQYDAGTVAQDLDGYYYEVDYHPAEKAYYLWSLGKHRQFLTADTFTRYDFYQRGKALTYKNTKIYIDNTDPVSVC
jgi:predicted glutamine amidotransferase